MRHAPTASPASFTVLYWGGNGEEGWDLNERSRTPRICSHCNGCWDTWRGRFENAQVTLRMCAAEGGGFKRYVEAFLMLSAKATMEFHLSSFYQWCKSQKKKVLTERVVLGTLLEVHCRRVSAQDSGVKVENYPGHWVESLRAQARHLRQQAHAGQGKFAALVLDAHGRELRVAEMLRRRGDIPINRLLIVIGGPDGIVKGHADALRYVIEEFTDFPVLRCSLPGGIMHSYYALSTLYTLHDQGVLLPFLSHLASELPPVNRAPPGHVLDMVSYAGNGHGHAPPAFPAGQVAAAGGAGPPHWAPEEQYLQGHPGPRGSIANALGPQHPGLGGTAAMALRAESELQSELRRNQARLVSAALQPAQMQDMAMAAAQQQQGALATAVLTAMNLLPGAGKGAARGTARGPPKLALSAEAEADPAQPMFPQMLATAPFAAAPQWAPHPPNFPPPARLLAE